MTLQPTTPVRRIAGFALGIVGAVFLLLGTFGLATAGVCYLLESNSDRTARADGVISSADYQALIAFNTASGQAVQFRNGVNSTSYHEGDHVQVAYNPSDPQDAQVDAFAGRWFLAGLFALIAGPFFVVGVVLSLVGVVLRRGGGAGLVR